MGIFDFFKRDYQSKAELRTINSNLEKRNAGLAKEINGLREIITQKNNRIVKLEGELQDLKSESNKQQNIAQVILRQKRAEIANLRKQLDAAHSIIDAREEDRKEPVEVLTELVPKRRRNYHRNSNGKFAKQEQEKTE